MEEKRVKAGGVAIGICLLIIAVLLAVIVLLVYKWNNEKIILQAEIIKKENELRDEINTNSEFNENKNLTIKQINEISCYIEKIYPKPGFEKGIPKFEQIENADKEWIWSVALKNVSDEKNEDIVFKEEAEKEAINLFGKNVGKFPGENEELFIAEMNEGYYWSGDQMSIPDVSEYIIKSIVTKENRYEVEIIEYLVHDWADGTWIGNLENEKIKIFTDENEEEFFNYQIKNSEIKEYVENNMEKFDSKVLTIEYNESENLYRIISVK